MAPPQPLSMRLPQSVGRQLMVGMQTQLPAALQVPPPAPPQLPQLPPQPSLPHSRPAQFGSHAHAPSASQLSPSAQRPQLPPQPSFPHWRPRQRGSQTQRPASVQ
jgi:hypothetical protein